MKSRKLISLALVMTMIFTLSYAAVYADEPEVGVTQADESQLDMFVNEAPSDTFIDFFSGFYKDRSNYTIFDTEENDITENFYEETRHFYENGDYAGLKKYIWEQGRISGGRRNVVIPKAKAFGIDSAYQDYYKLITKGTYGSKTFNLGGEMRYSVSGSYSWDLRTGKIATHSGATIKMETINLGAAFSSSMNNVTTKATVSSDKYSITFSGSFALEVTFSVPLGKIPVGVPLKCGTYSGTAKGYVH